MAIVTAQMVKELREMTLAGMSDCKKALDAAEGDMDKAIIILREKGLASAAKKASRAASEGVVSTVVENNNLGFVFEVNCETDFVTKNDGFQAFVANLQKITSSAKPQHSLHKLEKTLLYAVLRVLALVQTLLPHMFMAVVKLELSLNFPDQE